MTQQMCTSGDNITQLGLQGKKSVGIGKANAETMNFEGVVKGRMDKECPTVAFCPRDDSSCLFIKFTVLTDVQQQLIQSML